MSHLPLDARAILSYLNELGYRNISAEQLREFMKDLRKLIKYEERLGTNANKEDYYQSLFERTTASFRAKLDKENASKNISNKDMAKKSVKEKTKSTPTAQKKKSSPQVRRRSSPSARKRSSPDVRVSPSGGVYEPILKVLTEKNRQSKSENRKETEIHEKDKKRGSKKNDSPDRKKNDLPQNKKKDSTVSKRQDSPVSKKNDSPVSKKKDGSVSKKKDLSIHKTIDSPERAVSPKKTGITRKQLEDLKKPLWEGNALSSRSRSRSTGHMVVELPPSACSTGRINRKPRSQSSDRQTKCRTYTSRSQGALIPQPRLRQRGERSGANDPVRLYHYYQREWKFFEKQIPGQLHRDDIRWQIRRKLMDPNCVRFLSVEKTLSRSSMSSRKVDKVTARRLSFQICDIFE